MAESEDPKLTCFHGQSQIATIYRTAINENDPMGGWAPRLLGISSCNYGGGKVPLCAVCKLETQESGGAITSEFEDLKTRMAKDRRSMASSRNQVKG